MPTAIQGCELKCCKVFLQKETPTAAVTNPVAALNTTGKPARTRIAGLLLTESRYFHKSYGFSNSTIDATKQIDTDNHMSDSIL